MEANKECADSVRNSIKKHIENDDSSEKDNDEVVSTSGKDHCPRNVKRSAKRMPEENETVVVIKKRGNKVFIEI